MAQRYHALVTSLAPFPQEIRNKMIKMLDYILALKHNYQYELA